MICLDCKLSFPDDIEVCPKCNKETMEERRKDDRRKRQGEITGEERRMSERRKQLIKRFEEVFWKGNTKYC